MEKVISGINPATKRCELVGRDDPDARSDCEDMGLIVVPTTVEMARGIFKEIVEDVYSISRG